MPARLWLEHYAKHFDTVEVNNTFYRLPSRDAVANWERTVPPGFLFAIKASRYLTHVKRLRDLGPGLERFYERLEPLLRSPKLGPILWQLPPTFQRDDDRLGTALERLPAGQRHCFEFRHPSWFAEDVYALLREHGAALVIADRPEVRQFQARVFTAPWTSSASTTARAAGAATTANPNYKSGPSGSVAGASIGRSSRTSTTTGRCLRSETRCVCARFCRMVEPS